MVIIRLARGGAKKRPFYQIIVTDNHQARDGRFIERIGFFNPLATGQAVDLRLNMDRVSYWINHGAKMSERLYALVKSAQKKHQYSSTC